MKFVEDTELHRQDKERRKQTEWEALTGGVRPASRSGHGHENGGGGGSTSVRPSTAAVSGRSTPKARPSSARPSSAAARRQSDSRDEFFQRLRDDLDRRNRCAIMPMKPD